MTMHIAEEPAPDESGPGKGAVPDEDNAVTADTGTGEANEVDGTDALRAGEAAARAGVPDGGNAQPKPFYDRLEDFVDGHFLPLIRRPLGGEFRWCAQWWRHAEAISRLTALWHAWEALRRQPGTGIGIWYRDHLDHQLPMLLGARGPFFQCSEDEHLEPHRLRTEPAPPDWWPDRSAVDPS